MYLPAIHDFLAGKTIGKEFLSLVEESVLPEDLEKLFREAKDGDEIASLAGKLKAYLNNTPMPERGVKVSADGAVEINGDEFADFDDVNKLRRIARKFVEVYFPGSYVNRRSGRKIEIYPGGIKENFSKSARLEKIQSMIALPELLRNASPLDDGKLKPDRKSRGRGVLGAYYYAAEIRIAGELHEVTLIVREHDEKDGDTGEWKRRFYFHKLKKVVSLTKRGGIKTDPKSLTTLDENTASVDKVGGSSKEDTGPTLPAAIKESVANKSGVVKRKTTGKEFFSLVEESVLPEDLEKRFREAKDGDEIAKLAKTLKAYLEKTPMPERGVKVASDGTVEISGDEFADFDDVQKLRPIAKKFVEVYFKGTYTNKSSGHRIDIYKRGIEKNFIISAQLAKVQSMIALPELLENAEYAGWKKDHKNRKRGVNKAHFYTAAIKIADRSYRTRIVVREHDDKDEKGDGRKRFYFHRLEATSTYKVGGAVQESTAAGPTYLVASKKTASLSKADGVEDTTANPASLATLKKSISNKNNPVKKKTEDGENMSVIEEKITLSPDVEDILAEFDGAVGWSDILAAAEKFERFWKQKRQANVPKKGDFLKDDTEFGLKVKGKKARQKINDQVKEILERVGKPEDLNPEDVALLKQYSGQGGTDFNSLFEYYTPTPIAEGMWDLLETNGFAGGNVLEPSTGAGVFLATKKPGVAMTGTEIDYTSSKTASLLHPEDQVLNQSFEELAVDTPDNSFDSVIGNVPFGDSRGEYRYKDPQYKNETKIELYFIQRALDKVRPGGLVCLVCPTGIVVNKGRYISFRQSISKKAEFLGAHKLPSKTFKDQGTDVVTDILVFKKHPADLLARIDDLPQETLYETNVYFEEFIQGKYWMGEGKKFVHGKYTPRVEGERFSREIVDGDIDNESLKKKLALKFKSRIDWEALEIAEEVSKVHADGDRKHINGKEHELIAGTWTPIIETVDPVMDLDVAKYGAANLEELKGKLGSLEGALTLSLNQAYETFLTFPDLLSPIQKEAVETATAKNNKFGEEIYKGVLLGGMVGRLQHKTEEGDSEVDIYRKAVQDALSVHIDRGKLSTLPCNNKRLLKEGGKSKAFSIFANSVKADGSFSDLVSGKLDKSKGPQYDPSNLQAVVEHLWFRLEKRPILLDDVKVLYLGELDLRTVADIAPERNIALWPDGRLEPMSSFVCGDIYSKIDVLSESLASENNPVLKKKYQTEIEAITARRKTTPIENISFSFNQKWIPRKYVLEFLENSELSDAGFSYGVEREVEEEDTYSGEVSKIKKRVEDLGDPFGEYELERGKSDPFLKQFINHLNGHKVKGQIKKDKHGEVLSDNKKEYLERIAVLSEQFQAFVEQHHDAMEIEELYNRKFNSWTPQDYSTEPLDLEGYISGEILPHGYQAAAIRRLSDQGSGILGFGVGLGKTFTALGLHAYNQKMGRSKRTCVVVPNSVLANWYNETRLFMGDSNLASFLMIGFSAAKDKNGKPKTEEVLNEHGQPTGKFQHVLVEDDAETKQTKAHSIPQSNLNLVLMTKDFFKTIPLKPKTKQNFINKKKEKGLISQSLAKKVLGGAKSEEGKRSYKDAAQEQKLGEKYGKDVERKEELPYFEDMGFDNVTVDEADDFKNSYEPTADSTGTAYLPIAPSSQRAIDMTMKMDHIKKMNNNRGPVLLTATPVSNSPLFEVYNMLSLVAPEEEFERFNCHSVDDMLRCFGKTERVEKMRITGEVVSQDGLVGFKNLDGLRGIFNKFAEMKEAKDVGDFKLPPHEEVSEVVELNGEQAAVYESLKELARAAMKKRTKDDDVPHVFTVIRDMEKATTDMDLYHNQMTFLFPAEHKSKVDKAVDALPAQLTVSKREWDAEEAKFVKVTETVNLADKLITALIDGSKGEQTYKLVVPQIYEEKLMTALMKNKVPEKSVTHPLPPKYAKLVENTTKEYEFNKNRGKQIIFTEEKTQHNKILRILRHNVPVENKYEVGVINAATAKGDKLQKISDDYNKGAVRIVIANKKAEVGVNLQKGTNAIHHLTWPWNKRSLEQKNGRGLRQGNKAKRIHIYYYKGKGSIDEYRLDLIIAKGDQADDLLKGDKHEALNADAESTDDMEILLSNNPEEARRKKEERQAEALKAEKARLERIMTNNLRQMSYLADELDKFEETSEQELEKLKTQIEKLKSFDAGFDEKLKDNEATYDRWGAEWRENLEKAESDEKDYFEMQIRENEKKRIANRQKMRKKRDSTRRKLSKLENDLTSFDARREQLKKQKETRLSTLRGTLQKKKDQLPFDPAILENPAKALVTMKGAVYELGKLYECGDTSLSLANTVVKITGIDVYDRLFHYESFSGRLSLSGSYRKETRWYGIEQFHECAPKEVSYSEEELNLKKILTEGMYYYDLSKKISEEIFEENKLALSFSGSGALGREESGKLIYIESRDLSFSNAEANKPKVVYPKPDNADFRNECFKLYMGLKRADDLSYDFREIMEELFGSDYENRALEEGGNKLTESQIREELARAWEEEVKYLYSKMVLDGDSFELSDLSLDLRSYIVAKGDNPPDDYQNILVEFATGKYQFLEKEKFKIAAKREKERMEELKDDPNYKEVPDNVRKAFEQEGITLKINMETVVARRIRYEPFKAWVLQDEDTNGGILRKIKNNMKARWKARYMADEGKYKGSWWTIPSNVPLEDIFELIQATERP